MAREHKSNSKVNYLVGYYVSDEPISEGLLLDYISKRVPEYMVPSAFVHLERLPLTINGKLDRRALPEPKLGNEENYVAPRNDLERKFCEIYAEVLGLSFAEVGIKDDFFKLGGNSILAIKLVSKLNAELESKISVVEIFRHKTILSLLGAQLSSSLEEVNIGRVIVSNVLDQKLSFAQERLWFIEQYEGGSNAYNIPLMCKLRDGVDTDILANSLVSVVGRHEVLRSLIKQDGDGNGYQEVLDKNAFSVLRYEVSSSEELKSCLSADSNYVFNLSTELPIKASLYHNVADGVTYLGIVVHHIAFDGWSVEVFLKDLVSYYDYYLDLDRGNLDAVLGLSSLPIQYRDFALWQRNYLSGERLERQLSYWRNKLSGYESLNLPLDKSRPQMVDYSGDNVYFDLDIELSSQLRSLARELHVSLYSLLLSGYYILLSSYSNQDDIVVGTPIANRHYMELEDLVGFFVNSLALRTKLDMNEELGSYIKRVSRDVIDAQLHQDLPFEKLVDELNLEKDMSRHPIFQVMFGVQSFGSTNEYVNRLLDVSHERIGYNIAKFDLTVTFVDGEDSLHGVCNYATSLFNRESIEGYAKTYIDILKQIVNLKLTDKIGSIKYLLTDYNQVVYQWNKKDKAYPSQLTILDLFEQQVSLNPHNIALVFEERTLIYLELNNKANQLGNYLKNNYQILAEDLVVICLDRSIEMLVAMLGILKSGAAYVPIDPHYPDDRIAYILADTKSKLIISENNYKERLTNLCADKFVVDFVDIKDSKQFTNLPTTKPEIDCNSRNLAYVIYTSGTTGKPKGVMVEHNHVVTYAVDNNYIKPNVGDNFLGYAEYVFDGSIFDICVSLLNGASLYFVSKDTVLDISLFNQFVTKNKIDYIFTTTALFQSYIGNINNPFLKIGCIFFGGEKANNKLIEIFIQEYQGRLVNVYGPTETIVFATACDITKDNVQKVPIGRVLNDKTTYVLNKYLKPVPIGGIGELYLGGLGVSRGYLNRQDLTNASFIVNPFQIEQNKQNNYNGVIYKTGDLVRYLPDGNIEYIGRNDFQVKIRGFRIELGEIENKILLYPGIRNTAVIVIEKVDSNNFTSKYIVAYYVADDSVIESDLVEYLSVILPDFMQPNVLVPLDCLPLTTNGKLDKKALPIPEFSSNMEFVAPRTDLEQTLAIYFAQILSLSSDKIGVHDDFFKLGGNSIQAIRLINIVNSKYHSNLKVTDVFTYRNIEKLTVRIMDSKHSYQAFVKLNDTHNKPLLFMIHPGMSGCEVYSELAQRLSDRFICYGIDSYNLYHNEKITIIIELSNKYLSYIDVVMEEYHQQEYYILGWSFGGQLAMQIACELERRGVNKIKLFLLDTIIDDEYLIEFKSGGYLDDMKVAQRKYLIAKGYDEFYIEMVLSNMIVEFSLVQQKITNRINLANVVLFKALTEDIFVASEIGKLRNKYVLSLVANNVEKYVENLTIINMPNTTHSTILQQEDFLLQHVII